MVALLSVESEFLDHIEELVVLRHQVSESILKGDWASHTYLLVHRHGNLDKSLHATGLGYQLLQVALVVVYLIPCSLRGYCYRYGVTLDGHTVEYHAETLAIFCHPLYYLVSGEVQLILAVWVYVRGYTRLQGLLLTNYL